MNKFKFESSTQNPYEYLSSAIKNHHKGPISHREINKFKATHVTIENKSYTIHSARNSSPIVKFKDITKKI